MSKVEERVVVMKFDNAQFERGIKATMDSLAALNKGLQLQGATKGIDDVSQAASKLSLQHISDSIDSVASRFTAMTAIAITAFATIVNKAVDAGIRMAKSFSVDPVAAGLKEYETNLNSIQTILSNTQWENKGLDDVNAALGELNTYSDQTIYNFSEMARNIGTFTAAGVGLEASTSAIKGIANLAAVSGSNAQQASTAMYQLSQALATGKVSLMDWNSVVNAGMGGKVFQDAIKETARVHGVAIDDIIADSGSFRDSLQEGWLTSDILTETLSKFTGDLNEQQLKTMGYNDEQIAGILKMGQTAKDAATKVKTFGQLVGTLQEAAGSGWAKTWELLIGDFDEAKELWTNVNNVVGGFITRSAEARNKVLGDWKELGGRTVLIEGIGNVFKALGQVIAPIKEAFRDIFPAQTGQSLYDLTVKFRDFTEKLKIGSETAEKIGRTFKGVFAIFGIGWMVIKELAGTLFGLFGTVTEGSGSFLDITAKVGDFLVRVHDAIKSGEGLHSFFEGLGKVVAIPIQAIKELWQWIKALFDGIEGAKTGGLDRISDRFGQLTEVGSALGKVWDKVSGFFKSAYQAISPLVDIIGEFFSQFGSSLADAFSGDNFSLALDALNTGLLAGALLLLKKFVTNGFKFDVGGGFFGSIKKSFEGLTGVFSAMQMQLKADALLKIGGAIALITLSVVALSLIDSDKLTKAITALSVLFVQLLAAMTIMEKVSSSKGFAKMPVVAAALILFAIAIDLLTIAVGKLAKLDWDELAKGLIGVTILIGLLIVATKEMDKNASGMIRSSVALILLAVAINILVMAVDKLGDMDWDKLVKGLVGVGALLLELGLFTRFSQADKGGISSGAGLLLLAAGIYILAMAMEKIADLSWEDIAKGLVVTAIGLGAMAGALKLIPPGSVLSAAAILITAAALEIIADVMDKMGDYDWEKIARGLVAMAGSLTAISIALGLLPPGSVLSAAAIFIAAAALEIVADVMDKMGDMDWDEISRGLVAMAGALGIIAISLMLMTGTLSGSAALLVAAAALAVLTPVLTTLGDMKWTEILLGLGALAGLFIVLGVAGALLTPVIPTLIGLGIAIALLGVGMVLAGAGILMFSIGFSALAAALDAGVDTIIDAVKALLELIPFAMEQLGLGIIAFAEVISTGGPALTKAFVTVLESLLDAVVKITPQILSTLQTLLDQFLAFLVENVPKLVAAGANLITKLLEGMAEKLPGIITAATDLIVAFLKGIGDNLPRIIQSGVDLILKFIEGLSTAIDNNSDELGEAGADLALSMISGLASGLWAGASRVRDAAIGVAKDAFNAAMDWLLPGSPSRRFAQIGECASAGFAVGLESLTPKVAESAENVGKEAIFALQKSISGIDELIKSSNMDLQPVITPVLDLSNVRKGAIQANSILAAKPMIVDTTYAVARSVSAGAKAPTTLQATLQASVAPTEVFSFKQYNTSPKALSPAEIYRQTKNQLSVARGALKT